MTLLLAAWVFASLNVAMHVGAQDFSLWFWINGALMVGIPLVGIAASREQAR